MDMTVEFNQTTIYVDFTGNELSFIICTVQFLADFLIGVYLVFKQFEHMLHLGKFC